MSTLSNILGTLGIKTNNPTDYQRDTAVVIEEAIKTEKLLKDYIDQQRVFTDSLVEWTASKEPASKSLSNLARVLSQINFEWTKSQEVFRESISRLRHEFEVIAVDIGDLDYFASRYDAAKKELECLRKKLEKGGKIPENERIKVIERERRKRRDLDEYLANRENQTMVKVKRSFHGLAHGFMHQGASSFNIYQAFQTSLCRILPDDQYHLNPIVLRPQDYMDISEGRVESSLAIEREVSRSRANSLARSEERSRERRNTRSAPELNRSVMDSQFTSPDRDPQREISATKSVSKDKLAFEELLGKDVKVTEEEGKESKGHGEKKKKKRKKHRSKNKSKGLSATTVTSTFDGVSVEDNHVPKSLVSKSSSVEHTSAFEGAHKEETFEKPFTPSSFSGEIKSSSVENHSLPASEGFEAQASDDHSEKSLRSPMASNDVSVAKTELSQENHPESSQVTAESPV